MWTLIKNIKPEHTKNILMNNYQLRMKKEQGTAGSYRCLAKEGRQDCVVIDQKQREMQNVEKKLPQYLERAKKSKQL
jgi:hypothetical protein